MRQTRQLAIAVCAALAGVLCAVPATSSAQVGAASCPNSNAQPGTVSTAVLEEATRCLINAERSALGLSQLGVAGQLTNVASSQVGFSISNGALTHLGDGDIVQRVGRTGFLFRYKKYSVGEILAFGQGTVGTPAVIVNAWMNSPTHHQVVAFSASASSGSLSSRAARSAAATPPRRPTASSSASSRAARTSQPNL